MAKLPRLSGRDVIKALGKAGYTAARQKGSHVVLVKDFPEGRHAVVVPLHREIDVGTLLEIMRQARLNRDEFLTLL